MRAGRKVRSAISVRMARRPVQSKRASDEMDGGRGSAASNSHLSKRNAASGNNGRRRRDPTSRTPKDSKLRQSTSSRESTSVETWPWVQPPDYDKNGVDEDEDRRAMINLEPTAAAAKWKANEIIGIACGVFGFILFVIPIVITVTAIFLQRTQRGKPIIVIEYKRDPGDDDEGRIMFRQHQLSSSRKDANALRDFIHATFPGIFNIRCDPVSTEHPFYVSASWTPRCLRQLWKHTNFRAVPMSREPS